MFLVSHNKFLSSFYLFFDPFFFSFSLSLAPPPSLPFAAPLTLGGYWLDWSGATDEKEVSEEDRTGGDR